MSVISVARGQSAATATGSSPAPMDTHGQDAPSESGSDGHYDIAAVWTRRIERALTGLLGADRRVVLDWSSLSPMISVISGSLVALWTAWRVVGVL